jgi:pyrroline-5-carboxylate reductase
MVVKSDPRALLRFWDGYPRHNARPIIDCLRERQIPGGAMFKGKKIGFIGGGVMAEAMIRGMLEKKLLEPSQIIVAEPRQERSLELQERHRIATITENPTILEGADIVVIAVKPQALPAVLKEWKGRIRPQAVVLSIVAGVRIETFTAGLAHPAIVRSMPNTPAQIGQGITVWTASSAVTSAQKEQAREILAALGVEIFVKDEDTLDMATALSGTGPAYAFLFMEAMVDAGVHLGFQRDMAEQLVLQTVKGSVEYAMHTSQHLARLRNQVTSPGGTTAEALYFLEKAGFRTAISRAVWAAYQRSVQLGGGKKRSDLEEEKG